MSNIFFMIVHYIVCFSIFIVIQLKDGQSFQTVDSSISKEAGTREVIVDHYIQSIYFFVTTFTGVGYGDLTVEFGFANLFLVMAWELIGISIVFPYFIGGLIHGFSVVQKILEVQTEEKEKEKLWLIQLERLNPNGKMNDVTISMSKSFLYLMANMKLMDFRPVLDSEFYQKGEEFIKQSVRHPGSSFTVSTRDDSMGFKAQIRLRK